MQRFREGWIGRVHVGTTLTALTYSLPAIVRRLREQHPGIELLVTNMPTRDTVENIIQNRLDLGLVTLPVEDSRRVRVEVARGSIAYSAVTQPRPCPRSHCGGLSSSVAAQSTCVSPNFTRAEPSA